MLHDQGWGLWAVEVIDSAPFIGLIGLNPADAMLGYPVVEVGWRLAAPRRSRLTRWLEAPTIALRR
jgi:hypothetical protein